MFEKNSNQEFKTFMFSIKKKLFSSELVNLAPMEKKYENQETDG